MNIPSELPEFLGLGDWAYFFIAVLLFSATPFPIFATEALVFAAGALADPFWVGIVAGLAAAIGELTTYFIGLWSERIISRKKKEGAHYKRAESWFKRWGFWAVIIFAFTPLPMDFIGLVAGGLRYNKKRFFLGVLIGKIPRFLLIAFAGAGVIGMLL
jgi:membrane protein YqaA with SNARE-associated domain